MNSVILEHSVGLGGVNKAIGVALVQRLLKNHFTNANKTSDKRNAYPFLNVNGFFLSSLLTQSRNFNQRSLAAKHLMEELMPMAPPLRS